MNDVLAVPALFHLRFDVNHTLSTTSTTKTTIPVLRHQRWCHYAVLFCLAVQFALACDASWKLTPTHDEYWHLPIGLRIWKTGRFDCDVINPPLVRLWVAIPLALGGAKLDTNSSYSLPGQIGDLFWMSNPEHRMQWFASGRMMIALINGGTGWLLACWGRRWFGDMAALAVAVLWCGCPNILAHGSLVTHDAAAAFGFVSTLYSIVCWSEQPTWRRAALAGICLGMAPLLKVTCILLFPLAFITWFLIPSPATADSKPTWRRPLGHWLIIFVLAILVINIGYLGQQSGRSLRSMVFLSERFQTLQQIPWLNSLPIPVPAFLVQAFDRVAQDMQNSHPVFLDGNWDVRGFRTYYIEALAYKLPLGTWLMLVLSLMQLWPRRRSTALSGANRKTTSWRRQLILFTPILMLVIPASLGGNQFGIRYILPILPMLYLFASQAAIPLANAHWGWRQWLVVAALISVPYSLRYHPHHLAYFNEWAGGPDAGRNLLVDSNLDWGQDLHGLAAYLQKENIDKIGLAYFGTVHPQSLGIQFKLPPSSFPQPGDYAISANFLMGRPFLIRTPMPNGEAPPPAPVPSKDLTNVVSTHDDEFHYFRFFEPRARIGHSIYVYHLTTEDVARYRWAISRAEKL